MKVLVIGPSTTRSRGGVAEVIYGIQQSGQLNREFDLDIFPSYIDGNIAVRMLYSIYGYLHFMVRYRKYDLFHIHVATRGSTFRKALYMRRIKKEGKRAILHVHGAEYLAFYDGLKGWKKRTAEELFRQADMVLALSEGWRHELEKRLPMRRCRVLGNGIHPDEFQAAESDPAVTHNMFLLMGRLCKRKGIYDLVEAAAIAVRQNPAIVLCLAGDGDVEQIRALVARKGLKSNISILGWVKRDKKLACLKQAGTVILPSYHEGLPVSILEGMAAGKAIISTKVGAIPEVIGEENGILVESGDIPALADAILRCSRDVELLRRMSKENMEKAQALFSASQIYRQLGEYYREVGG